jgi:hypothetical protein
VGVAGAGCYIDAIRRPTTTSNAVPTPADHPVCFSHYRLFPYSDTETKETGAIAGRKAPKRRLVRPGAIAPAATKCAAHLILHLLSPYDQTETKALGTDAARKDIAIRQSAVPSVAEPAAAY